MFELFDPSRPEECDGLPVVQNDTRETTMGSVVCISDTPLAEFPFGCDKPFNGKDMVSNQSPEEHILTTWQYEEQIARRRTG